MSRKLKTETKRKKKKTSRGERKGESERKNDMSAENLTPYVLKLASLSVNDVAAKPEGEFVFMFMFFVFCSNDSKVTLF